jgi:CubicO group peptidase (beta-lactamase class C family)
MSTPKKSPLLTLLSRTLILILFLTLNSCQLGRFVVYNFAGITDYKKFPSRPLQASEKPFYYHDAEQIKMPKIKNKDGLMIDADSFMIENNTRAFLIIRNDSILYQKYYEGYDDASIVSSFSMAKSVTSLLIGCAIDDGLIVSEDEKAIKYLPELKDNGFENVTIKHLLQMTSGLKFNEGYFNPFGHVAGFYYGRNLRNKIARLKLEKEPGTSFDYTSGSTQLLGLILERAIQANTVDKTVTEYLNEKLWTPMQMEFDASWSIDKKRNGLEKTFCCINARARDFAKIGRLMLNKGMWNGQQLVSADWIARSTKIDESDGSAWYYQYQWWLNTKNGDFMAQGILGQYIYVNPDKNIVIVRLGKNEGSTSWWNLFPTMARVI